MKTFIEPEAPSTSIHALHHDEAPKTNWHSEIPFTLKGVESVVQSILSPRSYTVGNSDSIRDIEAALGVNIGPNFLFGAKNLAGQTIKYVGGKIILQSGTSFPVRAATNDENHALAA